MKIIPLVTFVGIAFLTSMSVAAHHGITRATTLEVSPRPVKMTCTILAAWTASGQMVNPSNAALTGPVDRKDMGDGRACDPHGTDCAPAINTITGAPLEARVTGC